MTGPEKLQIIAANEGNFRVFSAKLARNTLENLSSTVMSDCYFKSCNEPRGKSVKEEEKNIKMMNYLPDV